MKKINNMKNFAQESPWSQSYLKRNQSLRDIALKFFVILSMIKLNVYSINMKMQLKIKRWLTMKEVIPIKGKFRCLSRISVLSQNLSTVANLLLYLDCIVFWIMAIKYNKVRLKDNISPHSLGNLRVKLNPILQGCKMRLFKINNVNRASKYHRIIAKMWQWIRRTDYHQWSDHNQI